MKISKAEALDFLFNTIERMLEEVPEEEIEATIREGLENPMSERERGQLIARVEALAEARGQRLK